MKTATLITLIATIYAITGCVDARNNTAELHSTQEQEMTLGIVQREIRTGMSQADVAAALGSPNIVTKDDTGTETWVYDKIASEASYSTSRGAAAGGVGAGGGVATLILGGLGGSYNKDTGASAVSQRTLTVIIKFDRHNRVTSARYHSSRF